MNAKIMWMVRAGDGGLRFDDFKEGSRVSIGWDEIGSLAALRSRDDFNKIVGTTYLKYRRVANRGQILINSIFRSY